MVCREATQVRTGPGLWGGLACVLQLECMGSPGSAASPCGFAASGDSVTPSASRGEQVAFPVTNWPAACRQVLVLKHGLNPKCELLAGIELNLHKAFS